MTSPIFVKAREAAKATGLSYQHILAGCKDGTIPHICIGEGKNARFMVNLPMYLEQLNETTQQRRE